MRSSTRRAWATNCSPHGKDVSIIRKSHLGTIELTEVIIGNQSRKHALARACVWTLRWEIIVIYIPKLCYAALNISQVYLIQNAVTYVQGDESINKGYGLIGAFAVVYTGFAVSPGGRLPLSRPVLGHSQVLLLTTGR